jgi:hypothetical protein
LLQRLRGASLIGDEGSEQEFALLVYQLADAPFLELPMFPLPDPNAPRPTTAS